MVASMVRRECSRKDTVFGDAVLPTDYSFKAKINLKIIFCYGCKIISFYGGTGQRDISNLVFARSV